MYRSMYRLYRNGVVAGLKDCANATGTRSGREEKKREAADEAAGKPNLRSRVAF